MNGYKNDATYKMALWMHNDEGINNHVLPEMLESCDGNKAEAAKELEEWTVEWLLGSGPNRVDREGVIRDLLGTVYFEEMFQE